MRKTKSTDRRRAMAKRSMVEDINGKDDGRLVPHSLSHQLLQSNVFQYLSRHDAQFNSRDNRYNLVLVDSVLHRRPDPTRSLRIRQQLWKQHLPVAIQWAQSYSNRYLCWAAGAVLPGPEPSTSITLVTTHVFAILHLAIILLGVSHV